MPDSVCVAEAQTSLQTRVSIIESILIPSSLDRMAHLAPGVEGQDNWLFIPEWESTSLRLTVSKPTILEKEDP